MYIHNLFNYKPKQCSCKPPYIIESSQYSEAGNLPMNQGLPFVVWCVQVTESDKVSVVKRDAAVTVQGPGKGCREYSTPPTLSEHISVSFSHSIADKCQMFKDQPFLLPKKINFYAKTVSHYLRFIFLNAISVNLPNLSWDTTRLTCTVF